MVQIVLTSEQAAQFATAKEAVEILGPGGRRLGIISPPALDDDVKIALERLASDQPRRPTSVVLERLQARDAS